MESGKNHSKPAVGFLTVIDNRQHGLFGGYLILNLAGRPLEFHCTAPIKPNRAQQILYGPTLESFLYGEQIGSTLLGHAKLNPLVICTDREPVLSLRDLVDVPVALVLPPEEAQAVQSVSGEVPSTTQQRKLEDSATAEGVSKLEACTMFRADAAHGRSPRLITFDLGRNRLALSPQKADDRKRLAEQFGETAGSLDLWEPFTRIREAIEEAQQAVR